MQARQIFKTGAMVLMVAIALIAVSEVLRVLVLSGGDPMTAGRTLFVPTFVLSMIGTTLFVISFPITYARQAVRAGKTGLIGLGCYIGSGLVFGLALPAIDAVIAPFLYSDPSTRSLLTSGHPAGFVPLVIVGTLLFTIGNLCYGIGTFRAGVYPRAFAFSLMVAAAFEVGGFVTQAANLNLPAWTDLITDMASFGPIAAMAVWLLREERTNVHELGNAPLRAALAGDH
ncbi:MAG TPA: hypothetical protein VGU71_13405 [Candidatus Dormibacteraeota bacterium]|nr:hypothetical protein [Candidatus Dormibacteraeota bacterium]